MTSVVLLLAFCLHHLGDLAGLADLQITASRTGFEWQPKEPSPLAERLEEFSLIYVMSEVHVGHRSLVVLNIYDS